MPKVDSTAVEWIHYTETTQRLDIWYRGGRQYCYVDVPQAVYQQLLDAPSVGTFVNARIKPFYRYTRVLPPRRTRRSD